MTNDPCRELKPCPFCGNSARITGSKYGYQVKCGAGIAGCPAYPITWNYETIQHAHLAWNSRTESATGNVSLLRDALKQVIAGAKGQGAFTGMCWREVQMIAEKALAATDSATEEAGKGVDEGALRELIRGCFSLVFNTNQAAVVGLIDMLVIKLRPVLRPPITIDRDKLLEDMARAMAATEGKPDAPFHRAVPGFTVSDYFKKHAKSALAIVEKAWGKA